MPAPRPCLSSSVVLPAWILVALCAGLASCQAQAPGASTAGSASPAAPAQAPPPPPVVAAADAVQLEIPVVGTVGGQPVGCVVDPAAATGPVVTDARFYVHGVELQSSGGEWMAVPFAPVENWQNPDVALLSLVAPPRRCAEAPDAPHALLSLLVPNGMAPTGVRFQVGVPFATNHADPTTLSGPLSQMQMYWSWRAGFRFVRLDGVLGAEGFEVHYGSTGCQGETENIQSCDRPNLGRVELLGDLTHGRIEVALDAFFNDALLAGGHCTAAADAPHCAAAHAALAIDATTGQSTGSAPAFTFAPGGATP